MLGLATAVSAEPVDRPLYIYNWEAYIAQDVLEQFTRASGTAIQETYYDHENTRDAVISSGRGQAFDLILMDSVSLSIMSEQNLFRDLSGMLDEIGRDAFDRRWLEACGPYGVPYSYGALGMLYRESVARAPIQSWRQLFEPPPEHRGRVVMLDDETDTPAAALLAIGANPYTDDMTELHSAMQLMRHQQPHLLAWAYNISYAGDHGAASQMSMTMGFSGDEVSLKNLTGQQDWVFSTPREGSILWVDCFSVPAERELSRDVASFLRFINRPEVAALNSETSGFASANLHSQRYTSAEHRQRYEQALQMDTLLEHGLVVRLSARGLRIRDRMMKSLLAEAAQ